MGKRLNWKDNSFDVKTLTELSGEDRQEYYLVVVNNSYVKFDKGFFADSEVTQEEIESNRFLSDRGGTFAGSLNVRLSFQGTLIRDVKVAREIARDVNGDVIKVILLTTTEVLIDIMNKEDLDAE